jgi:hypothetical protein
MHGDVPLLGPAPVPEKPLRVLLTLEFQPDGVPAGRRLALALKVLWRRFRAKNLGVVDLPVAQAKANEESAI